MCVLVVRIANSELISKPWLILNEVLNPKDGEKVCFT